MKQAEPLLPAQIAEVKKLQRCCDDRTLAKELVRRHWLTSFQAKILLTKPISELFLGPYVLLDLIGKGGFGQVYKARHQKLNRIVALKVLRPDLIKDNDAVQRFYREIEVVSQLSHPNIVHAYEAGPIGSVLVLVMEYVKGRDLDDLVRRNGPLPPVQACDYVRQVTIGLMYAHERGLIHRDIKPSNLLVSQPEGTGSHPWGTIKILDLGLARLQEPARGSTTSNLTLLGNSPVMKGSPDYMSPEQALDFHSADIRSDLYSLGCTFYYLLAGQPPFPGHTLAETLVKHQQTEPPVNQLAQVPSSLRAIMAQMLAKRASDRFQSPAELLEKIARVSRTSDSSIQCKREAIPGHSAATSFSAEKSDNRKQSKGGFWWLHWRRLFTRRRILLTGIVSLLLVLLIVNLRRDRSKLDVVPVPPSELEVSVTFVSTRKHLPVTDLTVGALIYMDRKYTFSHVSKGLEGGKLIQTSNSDKAVNQEVYLKIRVNQDVRVYVGYDCRSKSRPHWLAETHGWVKTAEILGSKTEGAAKPSFLVYEKKFLSGEVVLPGNRMKGAAGAGSNYVVVVKGLQQ